MPDMGSHALESAPKGGSKADVWFVLILTGGTSASLQMWHAVHADKAGGLFWVVAALVGIVPAATAIGLSHVVVSHKNAVWLRVVTVGVMLAIMAASASAIAATVHPLEVKAFNWILALALDAAALACVWVLLGDSERKAAEASALELAQAEAEQARTEAAQAAHEASGAAEKLASVRAALEADVTRLSAELAAANATAEALRQAAHPRRSKGRSVLRKPAPVSRDQGADEQDLTAELRAIQMLDAHPELRAKGQGSELGRRLGISPAHGRRLHAALTSDEHAPEHPAQDTSERPAQPVAEHPEG
jgi:hypothetical protein